MAHEMPLSIVAFTNPDGSTGELSVHDVEAIHDAPDSVDAENLASGSVVNGKIAPGAVTETEIADGAVGRTQLSSDLQEQWDSLSQDTSNLKAATADSGWKTLASGLYYRKLKGFIYVYSAGCTIANSSTVVGTLPAGYRPSHFYAPWTMIYASMYVQGSNSAQGLMAVGEDGRVSLGHTGGSTSYKLWGYLMYPA